MRSKQTNIHRTSRKGMARLRHEMVRKIISLSLFIIKQKIRWVIKCSPLHILDARETKLTDN